MSTASQVESRVVALEALSHDYDTIFQIVCSEFDLNADFYETALGCQCPYGLIGYLRVELAEN